MARTLRDARSARPACESPTAVLACRNSDANDSISATPTPGDGRSASQTGPSQIRRQMARLTEPARYDVVIGTSAPLPLCSTRVPLRAGFREARRSSCGGEEVRYERYSTRSGQCSATILVDLTSAGEGDGEPHERSDTGPV